ncbi:MAG TPA: sulfur carrier protein ThiS [Nitrospirota bacterium]|nr:sulfur carrier protein ThiS [Nitrospirota bacterium]
MRIRINGKDEDMDAVSVLDVLKIRNIEPRMVAVEVNSKMIERDDYGTTQLKDGDEVEFLYFMGGGLYE